ncbi:MAG: hypothetical protein ACYC9Y_11830 [Candidatus Methylomirabilia bacterium]
MKVLRNGLPALMLVALALTPAPAGSPPPPNPHQAMNAEDACDECHTYYGETLEPHGFFVAIPEKCLECHSPQKLGRSHPIGVDPDDAPRGVVAIPDELPLENGKVSCGSCHNPHLEYLSETRAYEKQAAFLPRPGERPGVPLYKTYFLRMSDPKKGFEPLCMACHMDY